MKIFAETLRAPSAEKVWEPLGYCFRSGHDIQSLINVHVVLLQATFSYSFCLFTFKPKCCSSGMQDDISLQEN
jgi:hypothetical protein